MNADRTNRVVTGIIVGTLVLALLVAACGGLRKALYTAGGGAAGAAVGSAAGPVGTIAGAGIGAGATVMVVENQELRSGELTGEDALRAQNETLQHMLAQAGYKLAAFESEGFFDIAKRRTKQFAIFTLVVAIASIVIWAAIKLRAFARGREGFAKEVGATPFSPSAWLRALLAADGVRHTR